MRVSVRTVVTQLLLAAAYFGAARVSARLGMVHGGLAAASAAAGLGVAATVFRGRSALVGVAVGCFGAALVTPVSPLEAALVTVAAVTEAGLAGGLLRRSGFDPTMRRISDVIAFVIFGAVLPSLLSGVLGMLSVGVAGHVHWASPLIAWRDWALVMFARVVIIAALLCVFVSRGWSGLLSVKTLKAAAAAGLLGIVSVWLLSGRGTIPYPLLLVLFVLAAAYRQRGATLGAAAIAAITVTLTTDGGGPFVLGSGEAAVVRGETFVSVGAVAALVIAAAFSERLRLQETLVSLDESRRALAEAQRVGEIGSFELDLTTLQAVWSEQLYRIVGQSEGVETSWAFWRDRILPEDRRQVERITRELFETCSSGEFVSRITRMDGQIRWIETKIHYEREHDGGPVVRARGTCRDVTSLKLAEERLRSLFEHAPYPILVVDQDGIIVETNVLAQELLERSSEDLVGNPIQGFVSESGSSADRGRVPPASAWYLEQDGDGTHPEVDLWGVRPDGRQFPLEVFLTPLPTEHGTLISVGLRDVTELREAAELLRFQARHDLLTGMPNRRMFLEHLEMALARSRRSGRPLAVIFADLDDFKGINDGYGHEVGDELLRALTPRMHSAVRHGDLVARLGGDEFVILCEDVDSESAARWVAERVSRSVSEPLTLGGREHRITLSAGVVMVREACATGAEQILRDADAAMYAAKARGKGLISIFEPDTSLDVWGRARVS